MTIDFKNLSSSICLTVKFDSKHHEWPKFGALETSTTLKKKDQIFKFQL